MKVERMPSADHPRLAGGDVLPRLDVRDEAAAQRRADVLDLRHDPLAVGGEEVELGDLGAVVAHLEGHRARGGLDGREVAGLGGGGDLHGARVAGRRGVTARVLGAGHEGGHGQGEAGQGEAAHQGVLVVEQVSAGPVPGRRSSVRPTGRSVQASAGSCPGRAWSGGAPSARTAPGGNGVQQPGRGLQHGHHRGEVEHALDHDGVPGAGLDHARDVEGQHVEAGQDAGLLQVVHAVGEHAGGDEDQERAGDGEEAREVQGDRAAVEQPAEDDRGEEAETGADQGLPGGGRGAGEGVARGGLGGGPQEQRRLQALAAHGEDGQHDQRPAAALGGVDPAAQGAAHAPGGAGHPEDHPGHEADSHQRERPADQLLGLEGQAPRTVGEQGAEGQAEQRGERHAGPDGGEQVAAVAAHQVGDDDADDQGRLEPLTEPDQVVREHDAHLS